MAKYHINLEGTPGVCKARKNCPFGDLEKDHFPSPEIARRSYELEYEAEPLKLSEDQKALLESIGPRQLPNRAWRTLRNAMDYGQFNEHELQLALVTIGEEWEKYAPRLGEKQIYNWGKDEREAAQHIGLIAGFAATLSRRMENRKAAHRVKLEEEFPGEL